MFYIDRSRLDTYQRCPRRYYWNYAYKGLGVVPAKQALPLAFGGSAHLGLEFVLKGEGIEKGVEQALAEFDRQARGRGLELELNENAFAVYTEQRALLEALLRAWYIVRYPSFVEEYEIIDIEREEEWRPNEDTVFMARADGVLRSKSTGDLYILSFKTTKQYSKSISELGRSDIQGISELVAVEERLGERVQGIQMEYLVKGRREEFPKGSGSYQTANPLIRPWINGNGTLAHSWYWEDLDGGHTLGGKYRKVLVSEIMPVAEWITLLASGQVQPEAGNALDKWIVSPLPYNRNRDEVESWKRQVEAEAGRINARTGPIEEARQVSVERFAETLDALSPQHRHSCEFPLPCPYKRICFGTAGPEPEGSGQFIERQPNHPQELEDA